MVRGASGRSRRGHRGGGRGSRGGFRRGGGRSHRPRAHRPAPDAEARIQQAYGPGLRHGRGDTGTAHSAEHEHGALRMRHRCVHRRPFRRRPFRRNSPGHSVHRVCPHPGTSRPGFLPVPAPERTGHVEGKADFHEERFLSRSADPGGPRVHSHGRGHTHRGGGFRSGGSPDYRHAERRLTWEIVYTYVSRPSACPPWSGGP